MKTLLAMFLIMGFSAHANKNAVCPHMEAKRLMANTNPPTKGNITNQVESKTPIRKKGFR